MVLSRHFFAVNIIFRSYFLCYWINLWKKYILSYCKKKSSDHFNQPCSLPLGPQGSQTQDNEWMNEKNFQTGKTTTTKKHSFCGMIAGDVMQNFGQNGTQCTKIDLFVSQCLWSKINPSSPNMWELVLLILRTKKDFKIFKPLSLKKTENYKLIIL